MTNRALPQLSTHDLDSVRTKIDASSSSVLFVFSSGYEKRSLFQYNLFKNFLPSDRTIFLCFGFASYKESGSRPENDLELQRDGVTPVEIEASDFQGAWDNLDSTLSGLDRESTLIIIDYSSMPRNWYCTLGIKMAQGEIGSDVTFLYTPGKYSETEYPCVGYGEFQKFSGRPNITRTRETNIFGLGFDSTRTYGIWTYLDPTSSVAVLGRAPHNSEHCDRVYRENPEIIASSERLYEIRLDSFKDTLAALIDIARSYSSFSDVALVPDGPKPLIMAMSLVPLYLNRSGVYCWHVGHVKPTGYEPIDIESSDDVFGFSNK
jgi:hypothetical protein